MREEHHLTKCYGPAAVAPLFATLDACRAKLAEAERENGNISGAKEYLRESIASLDGIDNPQSRNLAHNADKDLNRLSGR